MKTPLPFFKGGRWFRNQIGRNYLIIRYFLYLWGDVYKIQGGGRNGSFTVGNNRVKK